MKDLTCPYCRFEQEAISDDREPDHHYERECRKCGKIFGYTIEYYPSYTEYACPCANGEPHDYQQIIGCPKEWFIGKFRCVYCGEEIDKGGSYFPKD